MIPRSTVVFPEPAAPIRTKLFPDFASSIAFNWSESYSTDREKDSFFSSFSVSDVEDSLGGSIETIITLGMGDSDGCAGGCFFAAIAASLSLIVRVLTGFSASGWLIAFSISLTRVL